MNKGIKSKTGLSAVLTIIPICLLLTGCISSLPSLTNENEIYNFEYLTLLPNQKLKTDKGIYKIKDKIRIWSDKAYLDVHKKLLTLQ